MAVPSKGFKFCLRHLYGMHVLQCLVLITVCASVFGQNGTNGTGSVWLEFTDVDIENSVVELSTGSVKKELRPSGKWVGSGLAEEESVEPIKGIYFDDVAKSLGSFLRKVSNEELGVTALQSIYDSLPFGVLDQDDAAKAREISERMQIKLGRYLALMNRSRTAVEELFWQHLHTPLHSSLSCCSVPEHLLRYDSHFGALVTDDHACDIAVPLQSSLFAFMPGHNLTEVFVSNLKLSPSMKWQYFISSEGGLTEFPAHRVDARSGCRPYEVNRRWDLFLSAAYPKRKSVILVIDHGSALSANQLNLAKAMGKYFLTTLSDEDQVALIALADEPHFAGPVDCFSQGLTAATYETKLRLTRFIDGLTKAKAPANHVLGVRQAIEMARRSLLAREGRGKHGSAHSHCTGSLANNTACQSAGDCPGGDSGDQVLVLYISRGLLSSLAEPRQVMEIIGLGQLCLGGSLVINSYALIDDGKPIMYEKAFLQDIALQNYSRYNVSFPALEKLQITRGHALSINSTKNMAASVGNYLSVLNVSSRVQQKPTFSLPRWDPIGKGLVVSVTLPSFHLDHLLGAVGADLHLADLVEDLVYFNQPGGATYAFLIDTTGVTIMHPSFERPSNAQELPVSTDIGLLETKRDFSGVRQRMLFSTNGSVIVSSSDSRTQYRYTWERVANYPYVICIVTVMRSTETRGLKRFPYPPIPDIVYHRFDLVSSPAKVDVCRYFRQMATFDAGSLYLSPSAFLAPFKFESWGEQGPLTVQSYMAFLNDKTKLIANPGLKSGIRSDVAAITQLATYWKTQFSHSQLSQFIVRRRVATPGGVLHDYPGTVRDATLDPTRQPWFQRALEFPGRVVLTGPFLDPGGAGFVVSVSHTVYEGKAAAMHGPTDDVVAVLAADFTVSYMHRLLSEMLPFCPDRSLTTNGNIRCFIMDDRGYLLAHPNLLAIDSARGNELQHLTHHEPLIASDLLNHESFVTKKACVSYKDRTVQRYYQLNLSLPENLGERNSDLSKPLPVLTNLVHGEHCSKYQIVAIPGTNLFVGVVNQTCEMATAFCPCSTVDRLCLNCHRMEQSECECPCECPLDLDTCTSRQDGPEPSDRLPTCHAQPEILQPVPFAREIDPLPSCLILDCEERLSERECFGIVGCEWCVTDSDGETKLQVPFCTQQHKCFAGVLRGPSPYSDTTLSDTQPTFKSTPVGPVAGGVMAFFFLIALMFYCYRQHFGRSGGVYGMGLSENAGLRMSQLDNEVEDHDMEPDCDETAAVVSHEFGLAGLDNVAVVSPYRVNTGYRRPAGGDSDHGYSTMTPHEDSEHTTSYVEPLLIGRDRYRPTVHSTSGASLSSRASSPLGPVFPRSRTLESPGTLHESADELESPSWASKLSQATENFTKNAALVEQPETVPGMTVLSESVAMNKILVPVTVHMADAS